MEVRKGFKKTEVGIIPEDWDVGVLGDLAIKVGSGITPTGGEKVYKNEGRPFIRSQNVGWGNLLLDDIAFIDEETHASFSATEIQLHDVLLNITGASIGRSAIADKRIERGNVNQHVCIIRTDKNKLVPHYINLFLLSKMGQKQIDSFQAGGNRQGLNFGQIKSFRFPLPPPPEQRAIAAALSDVDSLLTALDALIAKKRLIKQGTMQELLTGRKRLPRFNGKWEVKTLDELFYFSGGYSASRDQLSSNGYCYLHYGDIHMSEKTFVDLKTEFHDIPKLNINLKRVSDVSLLNDGDIVFVDASEDDEGASRHVVIVNPDKIPFISGLHTIVAKGKTNELAHSYRRYCFQTRAVKDQFRFYAVGTKVTGISKTNIAKINLPVPSIPEQQAIAEILSDMDAEIAALKARREKTSLLKQGMMQELLTGKTRLV